MTRTWLAYAVTSARSHAAPSWAGPARPGPRELVPVRPASRPPASAGAVRPGSASLRPASARLASRPRRFRPSDPSPRPQRAPGPRFARPPCRRSPAFTHPNHAYLLEWPALLPERSFDPGRDMLCLHTSPPRWPQWP